MDRVIRIVLICALLGGCASTASLSSLSSIGGGGEPDKPAPAPAPAKAAAATQAESPQAGSGSSLGGIWTNFSSVFNSGAQPVSQKAADQTPSTGFDSNEALRLINDFRAKKSLPPLSIDPHATAAAAALAKDMAKHDHISHIGPDGQDVGKRLIAAGYSFRLAAENVAVGQTAFAETLEGWKNSPPNSRNILLADAKHIGVAYEYKPGTKHKTFWALVVAAP
jgi:uncharacterized protein YkwD